MERNAITFFTIAYNDDKYIAKTIESIIGQTFTDWQYYIRDNGSTDTTYDIIRSFARKDSRIVVFKNEVNGVFETNEPHHFPKPDSKYLTIIDSDDYLSPEYAQVMFDLAEKYQADIVVSGTVLFKDGYESECVSVNALNEMVFHDGDYIEADTISKLYRQLRPLWAKLYRVEFFYDNFKHWFLKNPGRRMHAIDTVVSLSLLHYAKCIVSTNKLLHHYRIKNQSSFQNRTPNYERVYDLIEIYNLGKAMLDKFNDNSLKGLQFIQSVARGHLLDICNMILVETDDNAEYKRQFLYQLTTDQRFTEIIEIIGYKGFMTQFGPLFDNVAAIAPIEKLNEVNFIDQIAYSLFRAPSVLSQKLLLIHAIFDDQNVNQLAFEELSYWGTDVLIPKWYFEFCACSKEVQSEMASNEYSLIRMIQGDYQSQEAILYKNHMLDLIDSGLYAEAYEIGQQLLAERPLDRELLYLKTLIAHASQMEVDLIDAKLLLKAYYGSDHELINEIECL